MSGAQVVVAIFRSLEGESLEDVSVRLAQQWRIGRAGKDNGVVLVVFVEDRKLRLEVGYGLEGVIPDAEAGRIIREVIGPRFREGRFAEGLGAAVDALAARLGAALVVEPAPGGGGVAWAVLGLAGVIGLVGLLILRTVVGGRRYLRRHGLTAGGQRRGGALAWSTGGSGLRRGGGFSSGGGRFGGGGASGGW